MALKFIWQQNIEIKVHFTLLLNSLLEYTHTHTHTHTHTGHRQK